MSFFSIDKHALLKLTADSAVEAFRDLLWARARSVGMPITQISISSDIHTADGGVDASVLRDSTAAINDELLARGTRFQLKTGDAEPWQPSWVQRELFGTREPNRAENLGTAVRRCLEDGGRYVLVCFGIDPIDGKRRQACDNYLQSLRECGYPNAAVEVWGQTQLIGLFQSYPSLCLRLMGRDQIRVRSHKSWSLAEDMRPQLHLGPEQEHLVEEIREHLRTGDVGHIRLIGEPGVGKSRLALEATRTADLAPLVLYFQDGVQFQQSPLFNELLQPDDSQFVVLVVDECLPKDRASIWNVLKPRSGRLRLITIDHGPEDSAGDGMKMIEVLPTGRDQITAIISDYGIEKRDAERWSVECEGCPRIAHVIGENLRANRSDLFQTPATFDVWGRFIVGHDDPASEKVELRRIVLRYVSLFERFGFEAPVDAEARHIASLAYQSDPRLTWQRFQSIALELKRRRVLQGVTTLYLTPRLLHVYLYREFWENHGRGIDLSILLQGMPPQLWKWSVAMLRYAHLSPVAENAVDCLLGPHGLFQDETFPDTREAGRLVMALAETNPEPTLRCLQRTIGRLSESQLLEVRESRQFLVWALERIAVWESCFPQAVELLMRLAEAENANSMNNSTGTFKSLFSLTPGMAATRTQPILRLQVLRQTLDSGSSKRRRLGLDACQTALRREGGMRIVGPEHQGLRKTIEFWMPKTYGELWDAYCDVWTLLTEKLSDWQGEDRNHLIEAIISSAWSALHVPRLTLSVLNVLDGLVEDPLTDVKSVVEFIRRQLRFREMNLSEETVARLQALHQRLNGHDFPSKLRRFVKHATFEDSLEDADKETNILNQMLDELAGRAIEDHALLVGEISWLVCEDSSPSFCFAFRLGRLDPKRCLLPILLKAQEEQGEHANVSFLCGYLASVFEHDVTEWEARLLALAEVPAIRRRYSDFVINSGMSDGIARKVIELCRAGDVDLGRLERWWFSSRLLQLSERVFSELIELQLENGSADLWRNAVQMFHTYFLQEQLPKELPEDASLRLLIHRGMANDGIDGSTTYYWSRLATEFLKRYSHRKWEFLKTVLIAGTKHWSVLTDLDRNEEQVLTTILRSDPQKAWDCISEVYHGVDVDSDTSFGIAHWLSDGGAGLIDDDFPGPIQFVSIQTLFDWVDEDVAAHGGWLAEILPKTFDQSPAGRQTREFIARYGKHEAISNSLASRFLYSRGWCGNASDRFRQLRDEARDWLVNEKDMTVTHWINQYIDDLARRIQREEIDEERRLS